MFYAYDGDLLIFVDPDISDKLMYVRFTSNPLVIMT
jgi:hypothetical protein